VPLTEKAFQTWIQEAETHPRLANYDKFNDYWLGNYDDIVFPAKVEAMLGVDISVKANMCFPIINIKTQFVLGTGVTIEASGADATDEQITESERWLTDVYENNKLLYNNMLKLIRTTAIKGDGFARISMPDEDAEGDLKDNIKVRVLNPSLVFPKYMSDDYEEMELCAIKTFDVNDLGVFEWTAQVWYEDVIQIYKLDTTDPTLDAKAAVETDHEWWLQDTLDNEFGFIPVVHFPNLISDQEFGVSDLHNVTTLQAALLKYLTDQAITADYQAYKRIFVIGAMTAQGKQWDVSPGTVTEIPDPNAKVTEIEAGDLKAFIDAADQTIDLMMIVTQTPAIALGRSDGGVPSGYSLEVQYLPLKAKTQETVAILQAGFQELNRMLFKIGESEVGSENVKADVIFSGGLPLDKATLVEQHEIQINNRTLSRASAMKEEGVADVEAEQELIDSEDFNVNARRRLAIETESVQGQIDRNELTTTPRPNEVSETEAQRARERPPIRGQ